MGVGLVSFLLMSHSSKQVGAVQAYGAPAESHVVRLASSGTLTMIGSRRSSASTCTVWVVLIDCVHSGRGKSQHGRGRKHHSPAQRAQPSSYRQAQSSRPQPNSHRPACSPVLPLQKKCGVAEDTHQQAGTVQARVADGGGVRVIPQRVVEKEVAAAWAPVVARAAL